MYSNNNPVQTGGKALAVLLAVLLFVIIPVRRAANPPQLKHCARVHFFRTGKLAAIPKPSFAIPINRVVIYAIRTETELRRQSPPILAYLSRGPPVLS